MGAERHILSIVEPTRVPIDVAGHRFVLLLWLNDQWNCLPDGERPGDARRFGELGWYVVLPEPG